MTDWAERTLAARARGTPGRRLFQKRGARDDPESDHAGAYSKRTLKWKWPIQRDKKTGRPRYELPRLGEYEIPAYPPEDGGRFLPVRQVIPRKMLKRQRKYVSPANQKKWASQTLDARFNSPTDRWDKKERDPWDLTRGATRRGQNPQDAIDRRKANIRRQFPAHTQGPGDIHDIAENTGDPDFEAYVNDAREAEKESDGYYEDRGSGPSREELEEIAELDIHDHRQDSMYGYEDNIHGPLSKKYNAKKVNRILGPAYREGGRHTFDAHKLNEQDDMVNAHSSEGYLGEVGTLYRSNPVSDTLNRLDIGARMEHSAKNRHDRALLKSLGKKDKKTGIRRTRLSPKARQKITDMGSQPYKPLDMTGWRDPTKDPDWRTRRKMASKHAADWASRTLAAALNAAVDEFGLDDSVGGGAHKYRKSGNDIIRGILAKKHPGRRVAEWRYNNTRNDHPQALFHHGRDVLKKFDREGHKNHWNISFPSWLDHENYKYKIHGPAEDDHKVDSLGGDGRAALTTITPKAFLGPHNYEGWTSGSHQRSFAAPGTYNRKIIDRLADRLKKGEPVDPPQLHVWQGDNKSRTGYRYDGAHRNYAAIEAGKDEIPAYAMHWADEPEMSDARKAEFGRRKNLLRRSPHAFDPRYGAEDDGDGNPPYKRKSSMLMGDRIRRHNAMLRLQETDQAIQQKLRKYLGNSKPGEGSLSDRIMKDMWGPRSRQKIPKHEHDRVADIMGTRQMIRDYQFIKNARVGRPTRANDPGQNDFERKLNQSKRKWASATLAAALSTADDRIRRSGMRVMNRMLKDKLPGHKVARPDAFWRDALGPKSKIPSIFHHGRSVINRFKDNRDWNIPFPLPTEDKSSEGHINHAGDGIPLMKYYGQTGNLAMTTITPKQFKTKIDNPYYEFGMEKGDEDRVNNVRKKLDKGTPMDPVEVSLGPGPGDISGIDGRHRAEAAHQLGIKRMPAYLINPHRTFGDKTMSKLGRRTDAVARAKGTPRWWDFGGGPGSKTSAVAGKHTTREKMAARSAGTTPSGRGDPAFWEAAAEFGDFITAPRPPRRLAPSKARRKAETAFRRMQKNVDESIRLHANPEMAQFWDQPEWSKNYERLEQELGRDRMHRKASARRFMRGADRWSKGGIDFEIADTRVPRNDLPGQRKHISPANRKKWASLAARARGTAQRARGPANRKKFEEQRDRSRRLGLYNPIQFGTTRPLARPPASPPAAGRGRIAGHPGKKSEVKEGFRPMGSDGSRTIQDAPKSIRDRIIRHRDGRVTKKLMNYKLLMSRGQGGHLKMSRLARGIEPERPIGKDERRIHERLAREAEHLRSLPPRGHREIDHEGAAAKYRRMFGHGSKYAARTLAAALSTADDRIRQSGLDMIKTMNYRRSPPEIIADYHDPVKNPSHHTPRIFHHGRDVINKFHENKDWNIQFPLDTVPRKYWGTSQTSNNQDQFGTFHRSAPTGNLAMTTIKPDDYVDHMQKFNGMRGKRMGKFDQERFDRGVDVLKRKIKGGKPMDPPVIAFDDDGKNYAHDGHHRSTAAKELGIPEIPAYIVNNENWFRGGTAKRPPFTNDEMARFGRGRTKLATKHAADFADDGGIGPLVQVPLANTRRPSRKSHRGRDWAGRRINRALTGRP